MDNSIIELGSAFSFEDLMKCALECKVDEIILPDVFKKPPLTSRYSIPQKYNELSASLSPTALASAKAPSMLNVLSVMVLVILTSLKVKVSPTE